MTFCNESPESFIENAYWHAFDSGHYRVADKLKETLASLDGALTEDEACELQNKFDESESEREQLTAALNKIRNLCLDFDGETVHALTDEIVEIVDRCKS